MNIRKKLVQNTLVNCLYSGIDLATYFILLPLVLNFLGRDLYGIYLLVIALSGYLALMEIGVGTTIVKYVSQYLAEKKHTKINELYVNSVAFYILVGFLICAFLVLIAFFAADIFAIPKEHLAAAKKAFILAGIFSLFMWPLSFFKKLLEGMQEYVLTSGYNIIFSLGKFLLILLFLKRGYGVLFLVITYFLTNILLGLIFLFYAYTKLGFLQWRFSLLSKKAYLEMFTFSWVLFVIQVCGILVYSTDKIILGLFLPVASIVMYEVAWKVHQAIRIVYALAGSAAIPTASSLNAMGDVKKVNELFLRGSKYSSFTVVPLTIAVIIFAKPIIIHWLGPEYNSAVFPIRLFVSYWLLVCTCAMSGSVLIAINKMKYFLWYSVAMTVTNLILSITLVKSTGSFVGVIWGTVIPYFIGYPVYLIFFLRLMNIKFREFFKIVIAPTYSYIVIPITLGILLLYILPPQNLIQTGFYIAATILSYGLAVFFLGLEVQEKKDLRALALNIAGIN